MRKNVFILVISICSFGLMCCQKSELSVTPSGRLTTQVYTISDFDQLTVQDIFEVYVRFDDIGGDLVIEADDNIHHLVDISRRNGELSLGLEDRVRIQGGQVTLKAYVTTRDLHVIEGEGAVSIFLEDEWKANNARIQLTGASSLDGELEVNHLDALMSGACSMDIVGTVDDFDIWASGASHMRDEDFECDYLEADIDGASSLRLTVNRELEVEADGGSTVYYKGNGVVTHQDLSGGSSIIKL